MDENKLNIHDNLHKLNITVIASLVFACVQNFFVCQPGQKLCPHNLACVIAISQN